MARRRRSSCLARRIKIEKEDGDGFWSAINRRINKGEVIPILSNAVRNDRIFDINYDEDLGLAGDEIEVDNAEILTVDQELSQIWADYIEYPLPDREMLARVALYNRVISDDAEQAKTRYLTFLKKCLLDLAEADEEVADIADELRSQLAGLSFSDIASELDYPIFEEEQEDPLRLLARLPLKIFVTTSYYDFMERALRAENKEPRTQICLWYGKGGNVAPEYRPDPEFVPSTQEPLVYHLYGIEKYPESLILSEDDYLDFLVRVARTTGQEEPIIPLYLREALTESSLLLLGYRLQDWDFRVLFRWIINTTHDRLRKLSLAIQLKPSEQYTLIDEEKARKYLLDYFESSKFKVEWSDTDQFIKKLWREWDKWRRQV